LTYPLIIEQLRPEETPRGRFSFPHIADPDPAAGIAQRASASPPCPKWKPPHRPGLYAEPDWTLADWPAAALCPQCL